MKRPNIILVVLDSLRSMNLQLYGYHRVTSPNLEYIAKSGTLFKNAYAAADQTDPSFTTILSGRHPLTHGIVRHGFDITSSHIATFEKTGTRLLSELLSSVGYTTAAIDWLSRWHKRGYSVYASASELKNVHLPRMFTSPILRLLVRSPNMYIYNNLYKIFSMIGYCHDKNSQCIIDVAKKMVKRLKNRGKPYFLLIHIWDTHTPFNDIPAFLVKRFYDGKCSEYVTQMAKRIPNETWRRQVVQYHLKGIKCVDEVEPRYNASIFHADMFIGELMSLLENSKDETLLVVTADHGDNLVRDGIFIGHGGLFQRVIKVPLIMWGYAIPEGKVVHEPVQHIDIAPTIADIVGLKAKYVFDGVSLVPLMEGSSIERNTLVFVSTVARRRYGILTGTHKYIYSPTLEDAKDKFGGIWYKDVEELYDLSRDYDDTDNIANSNHDLVQKMRGLLLHNIDIYIKRRISLIIGGVKSRL